MHARPTLAYRDNHRVLEEIIRVAVAAHHRFHERQHAVLEIVRVDVLDRVIEVVCIRDRVDVGLGRDPAVLLEDK